MMFNKKLILFIVTTLLFITTITLPNVDYVLLISMYIGFILVGLHDLGVSEIDKEEKERQNK